MHLSISSIDYLSIISKSKGAHAQIECVHPQVSRIFLYSIRHIHIQNLEFVKCGITVQYSVINIESTVFSQSAERFKAELYSTARLILIKNNTRIRATQFKNITATQLGAVVLNTNGTLYIDGSNFSYNRANAAGGGVLNLENSNTIIRTSQFTNNIAAGAGGVVFAYNGTLNIDGSLFSSNKAEDDGGVMYFALVHCSTQVNFITILQATLEGLYLPLKVLLHFMTSSL